MERINGNLTWWDNVIYYGAMGSHGHTNEEAAIQQRLFSEMAFIGALMISFAIISYLVMDGGPASHGVMRTSAGVSGSGVFGCEDSGGRDAIGSDSPIMESAGLEEAEDRSKKPFCDLSAGRLALLGDGPLDVDALAPSANRFEEAP